MQLINKLIAMDLLKKKFLGIGLTYDDVLLVPSYSECLPNQVDLKSKFKYSHCFCCDGYCYRE